MGFIRVDMTWFCYAPYPATAGNSEIFLDDIRVGFVGRLKDDANALIELCNYGLFGLVHF